MVKKKGKEASELLKLLHRRWDDTVSAMPDRYHIPEWPSQHMAYVEAAAKAHAEANKADPFAYQRMKQELLMGYSEVAYVEAKANEALKRRQIEINAAFDAWKKKQERLVM